jgi:hypothetical protein
MLNIQAVSSLCSSVVRPSGASRTVRALIKVLAGIGGNRTTHELKQAMVSRGLSTEHVEELLDIAIGKRDVLDTYDGTTFRYQCQTRGQVSPSVWAAFPEP